MTGLDEIFKSTFSLIPKLLFRKKYFGLVFVKLVLSTDYIIFIILPMLIAEEEKNK